MKLRNLFLLGALALVGGLMLYYSLQDFSTFTNFETAKNLQQEVHVLGEWVRREEALATDNEFRFYMRDSTHYVQLVRYNDPKPANIEQAEKVYIVGQYEGEVFHAEKIFMKCPSKYEESQITQGAQAAR